MYQHDGGRICGERGGGGEGGSLCWMDKLNIILHTIYYH